MDRYGAKLRPLRRIFRLRRAPVCDTRNHGVQPAATIGRSRWIIQDRCNPAQPCRSLFRCGQAPVGGWRRHGVAHAIAVMAVRRFLPGRTGRAFDGVRSPESGKLNPCPRFRCGMPSLVAITIPRRARRISCRSEQWIPIPFILEPLAPDTATVWCVPRAAPNASAPIGRSRLPTG